MIRILLNIKHFSAFLGTLSGEVVVEHIDYRDLNSTSQVTPVLKCNFNSKPNQKGYKYTSGYNAAIFKALSPQIDLMIHSYRAGMMLAPHDFSWVKDSEDKSLDIWKSEKEREYEASDEFQHSKS